MSEPGALSRAFGALLLACAFVGCSTTRAVDAPPLPFRVAILPLAVDAGPPREGEGADDLRLELDPVSVERALERELDGRRFVRATLLAAPQGAELERFAQLSPADRDAFWIAAAERAGADLVLECELAWTPEVRGSTNEKFWLNLPLFLLGGPFCYFVDDRTYRAEARLRGSVHELHAIVSERASLEDGRARIGQAEARFEAAALDFLDRAGGNAGSFAASLVVPSGLLARRTAGVATRLGERVTADLSRGLAEELARQARPLLLAERVATFHLEPDVKVERAAGRIALAGTVVLRCTDSDHLDELRVSLGAQDVAGELGPGQEAPELSTRRERYLRFTFQATLADDGESREARIELVGGGPSPATRTFTIPLPAGDGNASRAVVAGR